MELSRAFGFSVAGHALVLLLAVFSGLWRGCRPPPPGETALFIELSPPPVPLVHPLPAPEPPLPAPEPPRPAPEPPRPAPEPPRPPPRPPVERSERRVQRPPPNDAPRLSGEEIRRQLARGLPPSSATAPDLPAAYLLGIRRLLYEAWAQPAGLAPDPQRKVEVLLRVRRDGSLARKSVTRPSGHAAMDESVQRALDRLSRVDPLPDTFRGAHRDITVVFEIQDR